MKKLLSVFLALTLVFALCGGALATEADVDTDAPAAEGGETTEETPAEEAPDGEEAPADEEEPAGDIVILYTNDVHCGGIDEGSFGYTNFAAYADAMEAAGNYVTLVDIGDAVQGGPYGSLTDGQAIVDIMNAVGYDVATMGNHEFDYGMDRFLEIAAGLDCGYVSCNFVDLRTGELVFPAYKMVEYGETSIAYVGITTPETYTKSTPVYFQDANGNYIYSFSENNLTEMVQSAIDDAVAEGADYVIAVGHLGIDTESAPYRSTDIIAEVTGLDAFIDGHSHSTIASQTVTDAAGEAVVLTSTGTKFANFGKMTISADGTISAELISEYAETNADVDAYLATLYSEFDAILNEVVAESSVNLTGYAADGTRLVRNTETNIGDLCADAYLTVADADIAFVNGGGIRADIPAGDITYGQIIDVHPYGNMLYVVEATGQQILDALEMSVMAAPGESGGFLSVAGLTFTADLTIESPVVLDDVGNFVSVDGERRVSDVMVGGEPIDPEATYTLASHDYMLANGGDGYTMFMDLEPVSEGEMADNEVLISYITEYLDGVVPAEYAEPQGRITLITEPAEEGLPFTDVAEGAWYYDYVVIAYEDGLMVGVSDTEFAPNVAMDRAMLVSLIYQLEGSPEVEGAASELFTDVTDDAWYADALVWASQNGLLEGFVDGEAFGAEEAITREELAEMLYAYALYEGEAAVENAELAWADAADVSEDAVDAVAYCTNEALMVGVSDTEFDPDGSATRAMVATVLARLVNTDTVDAAA